MNVKHLIVASVLVTVAVTAVAEPKSTLPEEKRGALAGAVVGAVIAGPVGAGAGAMIGGGLFGKLFGMNRVNQDLNKRLALTHGDFEREQASLKSRIAELNGDLDLLLAQSSNWTRREMPIQFKTGSSNIEAHYGAQLRETAELLSRNPDTRIVLSGFADRRGDEQYNQSLSEARVKEVRAFLLSHGVKQDQVVTHAFGESQPVSDDETPEALFFDRRVVMSFELQVGSKLATR